MVVIVLSGQSLIDIAIQKYGSFESVFQLAADNNISITDKLIPGQSLIVKQELISNKQIVDYFRINNINPATEFDEEIL